MKFISNNEYENLKKYKEEYLKQEDRHSKNEQEVYRLHNIEKQNFSREIENLKKDHEVILARKDAELDVKIAQATAEKSKEIQKLTIESSEYKHKAEILTKAFENLGFDVKDMKEILNKLVDGVVSQNTIQLVK